jgi:hypothetical protein
MNWEYLGIKSSDLIHFIINKEGVMKKLFVLSVILILVVPLRATTYIVDQNGGGQYTSIYPALQDAGSGDTVKVWPGIYNESVTLNEDITLMGSGHECTFIKGSFNPVIVMSSGRLQWFQITSTGGNAIYLSGGTVKNCVIIGSSANGIYVPSGTSQVINCVLYQNGSYGILTATGSTVNVTNCISRLNSSYGYYSYQGILNLTYSNGSRYQTEGNTGVVDCDPGFVNPPLDFHIAEDPLCSWNTGNPSLPDPDGSIADMGYFGGPDCPIYPVVVQILIEPNGNNINLHAKARANY